MAGKHYGRAPIGSAVLLVIVVAMTVLGRASLFGLARLFQAVAR